MSLCVKPLHLFASSVCEEELAALQTFANDSLYGATTPDQTAESVEHTECFTCIACGTAIEGALSTVFKHLRTKSGANLETLLKHSQSKICFPRLRAVGETFTLER